MIKAELHKDLSGENTFGMKVSCQCYIEYDSLEDLVKLETDTLPQPVKHIGAGSNLLFTQDFKGTILHSAIKYIREVDEQDGELLVEAGAGVLFDDFVDWACSRDLWGAENLSLIPGEVGAAAVQNIGAYGVEAKDIIVRVNCFDRRKRALVTFENAQCRYGYRESFFKKDSEGRFIVTSVLFKLSREYSPKLDYGHIRSALQHKEKYHPQDIRNTIIAIRNAKLPDPAHKGSAGSFFKNPVITPEHFDRILSEFRQMTGEDATVPHYVVDGGIKLPAAWMIEQCGFKGLRLGGAAVYEKQPLVIVNDSGNASAEDVIALERKIIAGIRERFGVILHPEVEHL